MVPQQEPGDAGRDREDSGRGGDDPEARRPGRRPGDEPGEGAADDEERQAGTDHGLPAPEPVPTPLTQQLGRVVVVVLAVLVAAFAVVNSQPVDFSWVFGATEVRDDPSGQGTTGGVPLILLLLATFAVGALVGVLVAWQVRRGRQARRDRKGG